jgi:hypothetical protein
MLRSLENYVGGAGIWCAVALSLPPSPGMAQSGPFADMSGSWAGNGRIEMTSGDSERIRCRATYAVGGGGSSLQQTLRCASDSYRFDLRSDAVARGGAISGRWSETTRNASGTLSGSVRGPELAVRADGPGLAANLLVVTRGDRQTVSMRSAGTDIREVSITLSRAGQ